ncbi:MAG: Smr/MutS family protein, partial [Bacteroidaceae bacterium]|nr:Smr/MutS family protein [Bacteroidaceae bacterium]
VYHFLDLFNGRVHKLIDVLTHVSSFLSFFANSFESNKRLLVFLSIKSEELRDAMLSKKDAVGVKPTQRPKLTKGTDILEIDLHIEELLETTAGMNSFDILNHQLDVVRKTIDENIKYKGKKIVFIHGKGEGVLRNAIMQELRRKYPRCLSQDASFQKYGFGATMVIIK